MKITVDKNVVEFRPEKPEETASLEVLWRVIVDCMKDNKKLNPIGEYIPAKENLARFVIEGVEGGKTQWSDQKSATECSYYCAICNKYINLKKGDSIPLCCGRTMEELS